MKTNIRIADERDADAIAWLNHDVYSLELGQYEPTATGRKVDRLHQTNVYIVAYAEDELVGMLSITLPSKAEFSTIKRIKVLDQALRDRLDQAAEMRLLAIKPAYRGQGLYNQLMLFTVQYCDRLGIDTVLISGIQNRVPLYEYMGFKAISEPVAEGAAVYVPMVLTRQAFEVSPFRQKLARLEQESEAVAVAEAV